MELQALDLLAKEFPDASPRELLDKWGGGANEEGVFTGANPVQVCVIRDGNLIGLLKVLVTSYEVYVDELLVAEAGRRQGIALHLFAELCRMFPDSARIRLQVKKGIGAHDLYKILSFVQWKAPKAARGHDKAFKGILTDDSSRIFMHAEVDEVLRVATSQLAAQPDKAQLNGRLWSQACFPIAGGKVDLVVNEPEENEQEDDAAPEAAGEPGPDGEDGQTPHNPGTRARRRGVQADADPEVLEDDEEEARQRGTEKAGKMVRDRWGCSIVNSYQLLNLGATHALEHTHRHTHTPTVL